MKVDNLRGGPLTARVQKKIAIKEWTTIMFVDEEVQ